MQLKYFRAGAGFVCVEEPAVWQALNGRTIPGGQWHEKVVILTNFSSLVAPEVVEIITSDTTDNDTEISQRDTFSISVELNS